MKIERSLQLYKKLKQLAEKSKQGSGSVVTGYRGVNYAVYVHEDMEAQHPNGGQAKFLEQPARQLKGEFGSLVSNFIKSRKVTLIEALTMVALRIQRESQKLVPVDTGNLKGSAFTEKDSSAPSEWE